MGLRGAKCNIEERAIQLLGSGVSVTQTAAALGVSQPRISQLLSDPEFTAKIADLRFESLQQYNDRDSEYDGIEDKLIEKLKDLIPFMMKPMEIIRSIQIINGAKRRGASAPDHSLAQQTIVQLNMPTTVINKFTTNIHNQVVTAGSQDLLTIQSGTLLEQVKQTRQISRDGQNETPRLERETSIVGDSRRAASG